MSDNWFNAESWGGNPPQAGDDVLIAAGDTLRIGNCDQVKDWCHSAVDTGSLGNVIVEGSLIIEDGNQTDISISAKSILVRNGGRLLVGNESNGDITPFTHHLTITLTGDQPSENLMGMGTRGIGVMGATIELHGINPAPAWTKLDENAPAGTTSLSLIDSPEWNKGDQIVIAPTDFYVIGHTEHLQIDSVQNNKINLTSALQKKRWGVLQYVLTDPNAPEIYTQATPNGVTLDEPVSDHVVLDERAEVGDLTRNIVIQGPDDDLWKNAYFGAHVMFMPGSTVHISGVEFRRMGQAGHLARYPVHFHHFKGNDDYVENSSIWNSSQRCIVLHDSDHVRLENNICYNIKGHGIFFEDGTEENNQIIHNLVLNIHEPAVQPDLDPNNLVPLLHEFVAPKTGPSGYWFTNPNNEFIDNVGADSVGHGVWFSFSDYPFGSSVGKDICPSCILPGPGNFAGTVAHSNGQSGIMFDGGQSDVFGNTKAFGYGPTDDRTLKGNHIRFTVGPMLSYKGLGHGSDGPFWNGSLMGTYDGIMVADYSGIGVKGSSRTCIIKNSVIVANSLNDENQPDPNNSLVGIASYHSECDIIDNTFVNLTYTGEDYPSGAFATTDYYLRPVDKGLARNVGNKLVNSFGGIRAPSPNITGKDNWALAGALWDKQGVWGDAENYLVYDLPFLTYGTSCVVANQRGDKSCVGPYYGIGNPVLDATIDIEQPLEYTRLDTPSPEKWIIGDGADAKVNRNMRHAAAVKNSIITVASPGKTPTQVAIEVSNLETSSDQFLLGVPYYDNVPPKGATMTTRSYGPSNLSSYQAYKAGDPDWASQPDAFLWMPLTEASSRDEVQNSDGTKFYLDTSTHILWVLCKGGILNFKAAKPGEEFSDINLYHPLRYEFTPELP